MTDCSAHLHNLVSDAFVDSVDDSLRPRLVYEITDNPGWLSSFVFGLQHVLVAIGNIITCSIVVAETICANEDAYVPIFCSVLFVCSISTLFQASFGSRLPVFEGANSMTMQVVTALMSLPEWKCPSMPPAADKMLNESYDNMTAGNSTDSPVVDEVEPWIVRLRELQGSTMVAFAIQAVLGFSGAIGFLLKFVGPLTVVPMISLLGLGLYDVINGLSEKEWGTAMLVSVLMPLFAFVLGPCAVPYPAYSKAEKCHLKRSYVFKLYPMILAIMAAWLFCGILTWTDVLPTNSSSYGYYIRTDIYIDRVRKADWVYLPYPGKYGRPTISVAGFTLGIMTFICVTVKDIGDYNALAQITGVPQPPSHAVNRGVFVQGICVILGVACGSPVPSVPYGQNHGLISLTKVCSRRVLYCTAVILLVFCLLSKAASLLTCIPDPVIGGVMLISMAIVVSVGLLNLKRLELQSGRNQFVLGFALLLPLCTSSWLRKNSTAINTGVAEIDNIISIILSTPMFLGGTVGCLLDNVLPATREERGLVQNYSDSKNERTHDIYSFSFTHKLKSTNYRWLRKIPISTLFQQDFDDDISLTSF